MNIFLALCNHCDKVTAETIIQLLPLNNKVTAINCRSCNTPNSVLMFTITMPEAPDENDSLGDSDNIPNMPDIW